MAWSQSLFLQALGWATLNSLWQMALLWCIYLLSNHAKISSSKKYQLAVFSMMAGTAWFVSTFLLFYVKGTSFTAWKFIADAGIDMLPLVLTSASMAYLVLLIIPTVRVCRNWVFLQKIRNKGLEKAPAKYKLFVQSIGAHLGIRKKVLLHLSSLVTSPVTVGYLKPVILLPIASLSHLSVTQVEAILLHELAHIRRHDYIVNLFITAVRVLLYFNPFIRLFAKAIERERENCCDEMVLQFEYDKIGYASALLQLEKNNHLTAELAMSATNKNNLLARIERIVGVQRKPKFNTAHFAAAFFALIMLFTVNSVLITSRQKLQASTSISFAADPLQVFNSEENAIPFITNENVNTVAHTKTSSQTTVSFLGIFEEPSPELPGAPPAENPDMFSLVVADEADASLTMQQKQQIKTTVANTKAVLKANWKEVEQTIPDGIYTYEKEQVKKEYMQNVESVNWKQMEQHLKQNYNSLDLATLNKSLEHKIYIAKVDSLCDSYKAALVQLKATKTTSCSTQLLPVPDVSVQQIEKATEVIEGKISELKAAKRPVIKL